MKSAHTNVLEVIHTGRRKSVKNSHRHAVPAPFHDNEYVHLIAENARDLIFHAQLKPEFRFDYVSPSSTRITGYTPEEFYADPMLARKCIHPDDLKSFMDSFSAEAPAQSKPLDLRWKCKDGHMIWTEQLAVINVNELGEAVACQIIARDITERKNSEAALLEIQQFNASLLANAPHATVVINPDTSIKYVNPAWEKLNGWTLEEVVGTKTPYPWWPEQFKESFEAGFKEALQMPSGKGEVIAQKKNGELYWIDMNWSAITNNGEILYTLINSVDITERMKSQEALRESESKYRSIFESANDIIILFDPEGRIIDVNSKVKEIAGYEKEELLGRNLSELTDVLPQESLAKCLSNFQKRLTGSNIAAYEIEMYKKNGELINLEVNAEVLKINDKISGNLAILRDITQQKRSMLAIKESEERFSKAFASSPYAVCIVSIEKGCFIEVNESFSRFTGYAREEAINHNANELGLWMSDEDATRIDNLMKSNKKVYNEQFQSRTKSGEIRTGMMSAEVIDIGGKKCMILVINDISEQVKAQKALVDSEEKFACAFRSSPNIMAITTLKDNCYLEINESFTRGTGYTREEIIGKTVNEVNTWANPEDRSRMVSLLRENGRVYNEEFQFLVKSGEVHTMLFSVEEIKIGDEPCLISVSNDITERKRMENAMKESEEKFSKAFASSPEMIAITSVKDARYLDVNESYIRGTGYSREELIGHTTASVGIWKSDDDIKRMARLYREHGRVSNEEFDFRMKSGEIRTWMFSLEPITIGGEQCFIGVAMDITERKRMEQAQRESEEKFAAAFHSSPDMITISNMNKDNYIEVNDSFVRNTGYTREELVGHPVGEINMFANPQESEKMARLLQEQGYIRNEEFSFKIKSGEIRAWLCSADVITIGGEPCTIAVATDITERKQAQQAQRESEEKFAAAFHSSPDMIIITSLTDGKYIDVNESFVQNTGYTREEFIGHTVNEFDLWADPAEAESFLRIFQEQNKVRNQVYRFRCKSGEIRTWLCSADFVTIGGQTRMLAVAADITERKKAEEALQESEEKFSKAFYSSPFSVSISRLGDGAFIDVNDRFLRDKGYTREEIIGHSSKSLNIWANHDQALNIMQTVKGGGQIHNMEAQFLTKSGDVRTGLISADIINIKNEPCMMVINSDITQQKQAEEQLRILSSVTEQVSDSTVITDPDFKINYMNQAAQKLFGYTIEEARGKSLNLFSEKPIAKSMRQEIVDKIASDKVWSGIITKKQKNGNIILCDCHMSPLYDEKGNLVFYIDVQRDVTRQKEIEAKLQEHKKLIDSILATMPEGVLVIDSQDRIVLANKAFYAIFHMPTAMKNKTLGEILPVDSFFDLHKAVKLGIAENNTLEFRYQVQGLDRIIYCIVVKMDGERSLLTFTDVTAEREKEEKLYLTDRLASLGEMAAGLAHELNNPLTGILALSQMLVDSDLPAEHKEDLDCINNEAKRAAGIVRNVLLFARNKSDVNGRSSINEVLTDVVRLREYEQKASNIKVVTELEDNLPEIPIDKGQLQQVFLNLISNAEAAVKEAGRPGVITVTTQRTNGHVNILVSDNGCGIKKDVMPRIFDPFFTTKEIGKGTGLGLSICYSIIVKHGGKINVKSQVNEGTTFTIRMPVVLPER